MAGCETSLIVPHEFVILGPWPASAGSDVLFESIDFHFSNWAAMPKNCHRTAWSIVASLLALSLLAAAFATAYYRASPPAISAELYVDAPLLRTLAGSPPDLEDDLDSHAEFITRRALMSAALKRPDVARLELVKGVDGDGCAWLAKRIRADVCGDRLLKISYFGERSPEAVRLVNGLAQAYIDEMTNLTSRLRAERVDELEWAHRDVKSKLRGKRAAIGRIEKLIERCEPAAGAGASSRSEKFMAWTRELEILRKAVEEGDAIEARIAEELSQLKQPIQEIGVSLHRAAEF